MKQVQEEIIIFSRGKVGVPTPSSHPQTSAPSSVSTKPSAPSGPLATDFQNQEDEKLRLQSQIGTTPLSEKDRFKEECFNFLLN